MYQVTEQDTECYADNGFARLEGAQPFDELDAFAAAVGDLVLDEARKVGGDTQQKIEAMAADELPPAGLIELNRAGAEHMRQVVDRIQTLSLKYEIILHPRVRQLVRSFVGADKSEHVGVSHMFVRVDLPTQFHDEEVKYSLPYHQESGYYDTQCVRDRSLVAWIPLYDCGAKEGCLIVLPGSHKQHVKHDETFRDPVNKKHRRVEVPREIVSQYEAAFAETHRGDIVLQHFNTIHKSGCNESDHVRYTLLCRASNVLDPEFVI